MYLIKAKKKEHGLNTSNMRKLLLDGSTVYTHFDFNAERAASMINVVLVITALVLFSWFPMRLLWREVFGYCAWI